MRADAIITARVSMLLRTGGDIVADDTIS